MNIFGHRNEKSDLEGRVPLGGVDVSDALQGLVVEAAAVAVAEEDVLEHVELLGEGVAVGLGGQPELPLVLQELPRLLDLVLFGTQLVLFLLRKV